jgi:hypothetical protein
VSLLLRERDGAVAVVLRSDARHARVVHVAGGTHDVTVGP